MSASSSSSPLIFDFVNNSDTIPTSTFINSIRESLDNLQKEIEIEANSYEEAYQKLKSKYKDEDIILDANDYVDTEYKLISTDSMEKTIKNSESKSKER